MVAERSVPVHRTPERRLPRVGDEQVERGRMGDRFHQEQGREASGGVYANFFSLVRV